MKIDLHLHTTASDGTDSPEGLIRLAAHESFTYIAIADHDTMDGYEESLSEARALGVNVISGIELSAGGDAEVHILGYGLSPSEKLYAHVAMMKRQRGERLERMLEKLGEQGMNITLDQVMGKAHESVGRAHLASAMMEQGHVQNIKEAFDKYLSPGKSCFVPRTKISVSHAVRIIRENGGVSVLAHPGVIESDYGWLSERVNLWRREGLQGIEAYHPSHSNHQCARFDRLARRLGMLVTGGSDYHGSIKSTPMGAGLDRWVSMERDFYVLMHKMSGL